jgi:hypothetical protein
MGKEVIIKVPVEYKHRATVYVTTDAEQDPHEVVAIIAYENEVKYRVCYYDMENEFYGWQLSANPSELHTMGLILGNKPDQPEE